MDILDKILWGRVQLDKRSERPWYFTGNESLDSFLEVLPALVVAIVLYGIVISLPEMATRQNLQSRLIEYLRHKLNNLFYSPRILIGRLDRYLLGEPVIKLNK